MQVGEDERVSQVVFAFATRPDSSSLMRSHSRRAEAWQLERFSSLVQPVTVVHSW